MAKPEVYVTGLGFSGTTLVCQIARELGWDLSEPLNGRNQYKGLEWRPLYELSTQCAKFLGRDHEPRTKDWMRTLIDNIDLVRDNMGRMFDELDYPAFVKCPDYGQSYLIDFIDPKHTIVMYRDMTKNIVSLKRDNIFALQSLSIQEVCTGYQTGFGTLISNLLTFGRNFTVCRFPLVLDDPVYAYDMMGRYLTDDYDKFKDVLEKVGNHELVHVK